LARGQELDKDAIFRKVTEQEGHPDNAGPAIYGGLVLAAGKPVRRPVHSEIALAFAVPDLAIDTKAARALLPNQVTKGTAIEQARRAAALITGLEHGDGELIAFGMEDQLAVPHRKKLIPGYDAAVSRGVEAGAFGVTISGAGSALVAVTTLARANHVATAMAMALSAAGKPAIHLAPTIAKGLE
jgi:homoserine kinase